MTGSFATTAAKVSSKDSPCGNATNAKTTCFVTNAISSSSTNTN